MYWLAPSRRHVGDPCYPSTSVDKFSAPLEIPESLRLSSNEDPCLGPNLNPPAFMIMIKPLSALSFKAAWCVWSAASILSAILSVTLLTHSTIPERKTQPFAILIGSTALLAYYPTLANFSLGQVGLFALLLTVLAWRAGNSGKIEKMGVLLGFCISLKPFFAPLLLFILLHKQYRALTTAVAIALAVTLGGALLYGLDAYRNYLLIASDITWSGANWNGSWSGIVERYVSGQTDSTLPPGSPIAQAWAIFLSLLTLSVTFLQLRGIEHSKQALSDSIFALGLPISLLISPLGWNYYFPILSVSCITLWRMPPTERHTRAWRLALLLPVFITIAPITNHTSPRPETPSVWWSIDSIYCYALLFLLLLGIIALKSKYRHKN